VDIILLVLHVILSLGIITLVLLQKGAGASAGAAFGGGGSGGSVFGATGASNFLSKTTAIFATAFFINSIALAYLASNRDVQIDSVLDALTVPAIEAPADPAVPAPALEVPAAADVPVDSAEGDVPAPAE
jgi:preprotein translocase subunit SecG